MDAFIGGTWRTIKRGEAYIGGKWRTLTHGDAYTDDEWKQVASFVLPLTVSVTDNDLVAFGSSNKPLKVTTPTTTAIPSGGLAPFTYAWAQLSGSPSTITSPATATTAFSAIAGVSDLSATYRVTVTDSLGKTATADVPATFQNEGM